MSDRFYDVVIIGAGTAGCAAATNLPRGLRALLVDRGDPAQGRCCGGWPCGCRGARK
jgi:flavin-dependent dehydrogenase